MNKMKYLMLIVGFCASLMSCEEDPKLPDNELGFEAEVVGMAAEESEVSLNVNLSRKHTENLNVIVNMVPTGLQYGVDFTTAPEAVNNAISLTIPKGETQATIVLTKINGVGFTGDEQVVFSLGVILAS